MRKATLCFGALALGLSVIGASTAQAHEGNGAVVEQFHDEFQTVDGFLTELCGFLVLVDVDVRGTFRLAPTGGIHVTEQGTVVLSNPDTGKTQTRWWRMNLQGQSTETVDENGILTIRFDDTFTGIPERWFGPDGEELIKDRGYANFTGELVIDLATGEVLHFHEDVTVNGPHPLLESGLDPNGACALLG